MNKLNTIINTIFVASIVLSTVAFGIAVVVFEPGKLLGDLFCLWILTVLFAIVGLLLSPEWDGDDTDKMNY